MVALSLATLSTHIAANVVSPANDLANLAPKHISFKTGGYITAMVGILIMPWRLFSDPSGYIFTWLIGYSALLGPIGGILIADYFLLRKMQLDVVGLFKNEGKHHYPGGVNGRAIVALVLGVLPNVPGFLATVGAVKLEGFWVSLYSYAWFVGFLVSGAVYLVLMQGRGRPAQSAENPAK
jgi:NCS1 family nucleobase:cation symporter-1